jgi:glucose/arabinose dehydrogenase
VIDVLEGMGIRRIAVAALVALAVGILAGSASGRSHGFARYAGGFSAPVYVTSAPGDPSTLYVVEQGGTIKTVKGGRITGTFLDIRDRVKSGGEQGLLSVAFSPQYRTNHRFYVDYTDLNGNTRLVEYTRDKGHARQLLFIQDPYENHNGGQLQFDAKGYLYVGYGDGGSGGDPQNRSQNLQSRWGKLLRINPARTGSAWQMIGYGLRNPWRFSFDPRNGNLWIGDVGQNAVEEIDFRPAAKLGALANYGWPKYEGRSTYDGSRPFTTKGQLVWPVLTYTHQAVGGCSVTGGYVVGGRYYYGDYCSGAIWSFKAGTNGRASAPVQVGHVDQLTSFGVDGNGSLYAVSGGGSIYRWR